jgi:signal transduction histidine kinase
MNLEHVQPGAAASPQTLDQADTCLHGGWLMLARVGWIALTLLILLLSAIAIPRADALFQSICQPGTPCLSVQLTQADLHLLHQLGLWPGFLAAYQVGLDVGTLLIYSVLAALIFWRRSQDRMALFCAYFLVLTGGATYTGLLDVGLRSVAPVWFWLVGVLELLGQVSFAVFFLLFPSGRFVPRWSGWGVPLIVLNEAWYVFFVNQFVGERSVLNPLLFAAQILGLVGLQIYRYRRVSTRGERQQTKWVVFGFSVAIGGFVLLIITGTFFLSPEALNSRVLSALVEGTVSGGLLLLIPISIAIAILRSHLWDIDIIINRALVYGLLTVCIVGIYVFVVGYLGALLHSSGSLPISLLATGLVAILFQPLREWLQRGANRLFYGQRDEPYAVMTRLSQRLEATLTPDTVLATIVETVTQALKLPYAAILLQDDGVLTIAASYGKQPAEPLTFPLVYQRETIGQLQFAPRSPGEAFTPADVRLLNELTHQMSLVAHAVRLTADLQRSNEHLQTARARLVTTREEERRRLRRDLHDGLGPTLAALAFTATTVGDLIPTDPDTAVALADSLQNDIRATVDDIRRLVYDLRPPALDELGLIPAIRERAALLSHAQQNGAVPVPSARLLVQVEAPENLPTLPAAVEVAAYRIVQEALTNVTRHAQAHTCTVRFSLTDALEIEITDDGIGLPPAHQPGVGLLSMRERAAELGGECMIEKTHGTGTRVCVRLPLAKE